MLGTGRQLCHRCWAPNSSESLRMKRVEERETSGNTIPLPDAGFPTKETNSNINLCRQTDGLLIYSAAAHHETMNINTDGEKNGRVRRDLTSSDKVARVSIRHNGHRKRNIWKASEADLGAEGGCLSSQREERIKTSRKKHVPVQKICPQCSPG